MLGVGIYEAKNYIAYFYLQKVVIKTRLQTIRIIPATRWNQKDLDELKLAILHGQIKTLSELPSGEWFIWEASVKET